VSLFELPEKRLQRKPEVRSPPPAARKPAAQRSRTGGSPGQGRLQISRPSDRSEREADRIAERVLRMSSLENDGSMSSGSSELDAAAAPREHEPAFASAAVSAELAALRGGGAPIEPGLRTFFEARFGQDFSGVRLHTAPRDAALAQSLSAQAFTVGRDIVFGDAQLAPGTPRGTGLLAHELAHVAQGAQGPAMIQRRPAARTAPARKDARDFAPGQVVVTNRRVDLMSEIGGERGRKLVAVLPKATVLQLDRLHPRGSGRVFFATVIGGGEAAAAGHSGIVAAEWIEHAPDQAPRVDLPSASEQSSERLPSGEQVLSFEVQGEDLIFDVRSRSEYIDQQVEAVGVGLLLGGYVLYLRGVNEPVFVSNDMIGTGLHQASPANETVHPDRDAATAEASRRGAPFAYYRTINGIIAPTVFSPASTPRIMALAAQGFREIGQMGEQIFKQMAIAMIGGKVIGLTIGRIVRMSAGSSSGPPRGGGTTGGGSQGSTGTPPSQNRVSEPEATAPVPTSARPPAPRAAEPAKAPKPAQAPASEQAKTPAGADEASVTAQLRQLRGKANQARWVRSRQGEEGPGLRDHFEAHGPEVGARTAREYDLSARLTIQNGRRFRYRDRATGEPRVGYWNPQTGLFTATSETRSVPAILTHFPETFANLRKLPGFTLD